MTKDERIDRLEKAVRELSEGIRYQVQTYRERCGASVEQLMRDPPPESELSAYREWEAGLGSRLLGPVAYSERRQAWNACVDAAVTAANVGHDSDISMNILALKEPDGGEIIDASNGTTKTS